MNKSRLDIESKIDTLKVEGLRENKPEYIVVHSTRSYPDFSDLLQNHRSRGFAGVGYHYFVSSNDKTYQARPDLLEGAHALGFNTNSIGLGFYAPNSELTDSKVLIGKTLIAQLKEKFGDLKVISHTFAQMDYINRLLKLSNYEKQFVFDEDIVTPKQFGRVSQELNRFIGTLTTSHDQPIKEKLKSFKNCPGSLFKQLLY